MKLEFSRQVFEKCSYTEYHENLSSSIQADGHDEDIVACHNFANAPKKEMSMENTGLSKKMDGILNRYNLKSTGRIYTIGVLKCSEKFKVLDLP